MLPISIFVLALLGGFIFVSKWYPTRYYTLRSDGYRLIFAASLAGILLLFLSTVLLACASLCFPRAVLWSSTFWHTLVPADNSGKAAVAFLLGCCTWKPLNWLGAFIPYLSDKDAIDRAISRKNDPLEIFLRKALGDGSTISISTKSGKVYAGKLLTNLNPSFPVEFISLYTLYSGHRDKATQKFEIDIDYERIYADKQADLTSTWKKKVEQIFDKNPENTNLEEIYRAVADAIEPESENRETIIPVSEIQSVNFFDKRIYDLCAKPAPN